MKCPRCRRDNPENAAYCRRCEFDLTTDRDHPRPDDRKTSPVAIAAFVLSLLSFGLYIFAAIPALMLALFARANIEREPWRHTGRPLAKKAILLSIISTLVLTGALFYLWTLDAPPIPNDYTIADLRSAPPEFNETFELLKSITGDSGESPGAAAGLTRQDIETIDNLADLLADANEAEISAVLTENRQFIEQAWSKTENARRTIAQLAQFEQIADLTEPGPDVRLISTPTFLHIARLHLVLTYLRREQAHINAAVSDLVQFDAIIRKFAINARPLIVKIVCLMCLRTDITTANALVNDPSVSDESLVILAGHFAPLTEDHVSLRNLILFPYLGFKAIVSGQLGARRAPNRLLFKLNSSLRLLRTHTDYWLSKIEPGAASPPPHLSLWPEIYSFLGPVSIDPDTGRPPLLYRLYNPQGAQILDVLTPGFKRNYDKFGDRILNVLVLDDLLQIVLSKRLARPFSLKARAYGDNYIIDLENKRIFSPGPDLAPNTEDDISLPIDPEVLGFDK